MSEQDDVSSWKSSTDGDRAWKQARERIAARNDAARKVGRLEREATERERKKLRKAAAEKRGSGY